MFILVAIIFYKCGVANVYRYLSLTQHLNLTHWSTRIFLNLQLYCLILVQILKPEIKWQILWSQFTTDLPAVYVSTSAFQLGLYSPANSPLHAESASFSNIFSSFMMSNFSAFDLFCLQCRKKCTQDQLFATLETELFTKPCFRQCFSALRW